MGQIVKNTITGKKIERPEPIDIQIPFDGGVMITETDTAGIITYANRKFIDMIGYTKEELIGSPHNINRHPDMPKAVYKDMWKTIKAGHNWEGFVKNLCHDGTYYNVIISIKPKLDDDGNIIGYICGRKIADEKLMQKALDEYKLMIEKEKGLHSIYHL
jgi:PAS domain S-box-containing protein